MSKSKGKMKSSPRPAKKRKVSGAERKARKNVAKNSTIIFWFTAIVLVVLFIGRWVVAIANGYYASFVEMTNTVSAVQNMKGLNPGENEKAQLLPLEKRWDLFTSSRLRDEVSVTASDGAQLHGYLYNEGSSVTVVVLPRFYNDGTADFLPGTYLNELTGCNILLPDPRMHGDSGGGYFTFGVSEKNDIADWLAWAEQTLGPQTFILWGEGTGANTILLAAADDLLPENVAFIVAESPYASLHEFAKESIWKWYSVPTFPFLNAIEMKVSSSKAGFAVKDVEIAAALESSGADVPVLFLHSEYDAYILPVWSEAVEQAYPGVNEVVSGGASHGTVYAAEQSRVDRILADWWAEYGA